MQQTAHFAFSMAHGNKTQNTKHKTSHSHSHSHQQCHQWPTSGHSPATDADATP
jgi:hypothetical protein